MGPSVVAWWVTFALPCHAFTCHDAAIGPRAMRIPRLRAISMWQALSDVDPRQSFRAIFGARGERGEYMDGYGAQAMEKRCTEDYGWTFPSPDGYATERAKMMCHLYDNEELWQHVCMVAFAEHYVLTNDDEKKGADGTDETMITKPFDTFHLQRELQSSDEPIFAGVVLVDWENARGNGNCLNEKLLAFREKGVDYVRLECNFGTVEDIGEASNLADNPLLNGRFQQLAATARACQRQEMVPLVLIQVPWREETTQSEDYFAQAIECFANALKDEEVESKRLLLETRPPVGMSARQEKELDETARTSLGLDTGRKMFEVIEGAFGGDTIPGFCVAGGSTKGENPTAMEDDVQNAVRQGIRQKAMLRWGYAMCFWEMGAKLMLQPRVGQLWGDGQDGIDMARELFCANAKALSEEIVNGI